jgi:hypothetical protein
MIRRWTNSAGSTISVTQSGTGSRVEAPAIGRHLASTSGGARRADDLAEFAIRVEGQLDPDGMGGFEGMLLTTDGDGTVTLRGMLDGVGALRSLLIALQARQLGVLTVHCMDRLEAVKDSTSKG